MFALPAQIELHLGAGQHQGRLEADAQAAAPPQADRRVARPSEGKGQTIVLLAVHHSRARPARARAGPRQAAPRQAARHRRTGFRSRHGPPASPTSSAAAGADDRDRLVRGRQLACPTGWPSTRHPGGRRARLRRARTGHRRRRLRRARRDDVREDAVPRAAPRRPAAADAARAARLSGARTATWSCRRRIPRPTPASSSWSRSSTRRCPAPTRSASRRRCSRPG